MNVMFPAQYLPHTNVRTLDKLAPIGVWVMVVASMLAIVSNDATAHYDPVASLHTCQNIAVATLSCTQDYITVLRAARLSADWRA